MNRPGPGLALLLSLLLLALRLSAAQPAAARSTNAAENDPEALLQHGSLRLTRAWRGDLDGMEERRRIRILTVHSPGRYYLDGGRGRGLVAEMATRFEDFINKRMERDHIRVHTLIIPVARHQLIPALLAGKGDIAVADLTITEERRQQVEFSIPASKPINEIMVTGPNAPALRSLDDLAGQTVYLRRSSSYEESVSRLSDALVERGRDPIRIQAMPEALEDDDIIEMVNAGLLPWAVVDDYKPRLWKDVFTGLTVRDDLVLRRGGRTAWAMRPGSPLLLQAVNDFLRTHREGTLFGNILVNRYVRDFDWAANALAAEDYQRFNDLQHLFRRYGERYNIEYLLAAAQGYQESRLDQSVRSPAGAIGVMQLLPSTAADPNVAIPDIQQVDANIHAGIKYLDFLRDRYFASEEISLINQELLALAAYNAGPARLARLRARAAQRGYDPNVWFDNVELLAAEAIGRETVQYVSNIYRYYLSYRMVAMQELLRAQAREAAGISAVPDPGT